MAKNVYIHIPFCKGGKCNYCSFVSYPEIELKEKYLDALAVEIKQSYKGEIYKIELSLDNFLTPLTIIL